MVGVLVVDDSVVMRRLISDALAGEPGISVVGTAVNGRAALDRLEQLLPDVVTLDMEMPVLDGAETLRQIRKTNQSLPVIVCSAFTRRGAIATLDALAAGASDYVTKPSRLGSAAESMAEIRRQLVPRIHALAATSVTAGHARTGARGPTRIQPPTPAGPLGIVAIGCSTGGPMAIEQVLGALPEGFGVPVVVVQHMPPIFTQILAERLDRLSTLRVVEARDGMSVTSGTVYLAPGSHHLVIARGAAGNPLTRLTDAPAENSCRPSVDVLFRSVAQVYGKAVVGVVLTGMGRDGRSGAAHIRDAGGEILAQDEATSAVWGMPGAVVAAGLAGTVLPLGSIAPWIAGRVTAGERTREGSSPR